MSHFAFSDCSFDTGLGLIVIYIVLRLIAALVCCLYSIDQWRTGLGFMQTKSPCGNKKTSQNALLEPIGCYLTTI